MNYFFCKERENNLVFPVLCSYRDAAEAALSDDAQLLPCANLLGKSLHTWHKERSLADKLFPSSCLARVCKCFHGSVEQLVHSTELPVKGSSCHPKGALFGPSVSREVLTVPGTSWSWWGQTRGGWGRSAPLYQVAFCFSFQLFPRLIHDGRDHAEEGKRLPRGPDSKETGW